SNGLKHTNCKRRGNNQIANCRSMVVLCEQKIHRIVIAVNGASLTSIVSHTTGERTMKRIMKTLSCTLAAFAMVMSTYIPAHATFMGTISRERPWEFVVVNNEFNPAAVTVYFLDLNRR